MKLILGAMVLAVLLPVTTAGAQVSDGDVVLVANGPVPFLLGVYAVPHGGGSPTTLLGVWNLTAVGGLTAAPLNDGILFTCLPFGVSNPTNRLLHLDRAGVVHTQVALPSSFPFVATTIIDQRGDVLLLNQTPKAVDGGIYRWAPRSKILTPIATGLPDAVAMTEDLLSGDLLVATVNGDVHRIARTGKIVSVNRGVFPAHVNLRGKFDANIGDGSVLAALTKLYRYDPRTGVAATLTPPPGIVLGIDYNPVHRDHYITLNVELQRYDLATGRSVRLWSYFPYQVFPSDVVTWGSRMLTGAGIPTPGASYPIHLVIPGEAGRPFLAGAALGTLRGIPTPAGRIPLDPDPLLVLSLTNPAIFRGFHGTLDTSGAATLSLVIPPAPVLRGQRFYVAAITHDPTGTRRITEPLGIVVE